MSRFSLITAIGTPLDENEEIHIRGLEAEIEDQWSNGITGLLVAGTMGAMQLLSDAAYQQLIDHSIRCSQGSRARNCPSTLCERQPSIQISTGLNVLATSAGPGRCWI